MADKKYTYKIRKKVTIPLSDGKTKRVEIYANTQAEFNKKLAAATLKAQEAAKKQASPLFTDIADEWNELHEKEIEFYTYSSYQAPLKDLKREFDKKQITDISAQDLQIFLNRMSKNGYAKHTIQLRKIVASQIFDYAIVEKKVIQYNPCISVKIPRNAPKTSYDLPSDSDIEIVKQSVDKPFGLFAYLVLFTGCRRGEALALRYEDIDFDNNLITINKVLVFKYGKPVIENRTKSKSGTRTIPLLAPLRNVLDKNGKGYIFNIDGALLTLSQFNVNWERYKRLSGINISPHQLRHAFATICFDASIPAKDAAELLGHSKIQLTLDIYTHIRKSRRKDVFDKLNEYVS